MSFQIVDATDIDEPVSIAEQKAFSRIDIDYTVEDSLIEVLISTARERLEQYLNIGLANRDITLQWPGYPIKLPLSPTGAVTSLKDQDGTTIPPDDYTLNGYQSKTIRINSNGSSNVEWFYDITGSYVTPWSWGNNGCDTMYSLVYNTGYEDLPKTLKQAIMAEADYLYKLRGSAVTDVISPNAALIAKGYSQNLIIQ